MFGIFNITAEVEPKSPCGHTWGHIWGSGARVATGVVQPHMRPHMCPHLWIAPHVWNIYSHEAARVDCATPVAIHKATRVATAFCAQVRARAFCDTWYGLSWDSDLPLSDNVDGISLTGAEILAFTIWNQHHQIYEANENWVFVSKIGAILQTNFKYKYLGSCRK